MWQFLGAHEDVGDSHGRELCMALGCKVVGQINVIGDACDLRSRPERRQVVAISHCLVADHLHDRPARKSAQLARGEKIRDLKTSRYRTLRASNRIGGDGSSEMIIEKEDILVPWYATSASSARERRECVLVLSRLYSGLRACCSRRSGSSSAPRPPVCAVPSTRRCVVPTAARTATPARPGPRVWYTVMAHALAWPQRLH